jgi:Ca2+-binding RTX toxin-like protein
MQIRLEADGDLRIVGTYFDDFVQITRSDGILHIRAEQRIDGEAFWDEYRDIRVEKVTKIFFTGHEGNDRFVANTEILTQAEGGDHDDTIVCGGSIHGGKGNDTLIASGYRYGGTLFGSYVDGGENNDEIWGSSLPDYLDGGSGLNTIHGDADDIIVNNSSPFTQEYGPAQGNTGELSLD